MEGERGCEEGERGCEDGGGVWCKDGGGGEGM